MGSSEGLPDERPRCRVQISRPFWMGCLEVTNEQYANLIRATTVEWNRDLGCSLECAASMSIGPHNRSCESRGTRR